MNEQKITLLEACRQRGLRMTRQREVIVRLLDSAEAHLDARDLLELARQAVPDIDKTTIYRTIRRLHSLGLIDELDLMHRLDHGGHFYEPLPGKMHLHIVCLGCGKVSEMQPESWALVEKEVEEAEQMQIERARVEIGGYCSGCRAEG